MRTTIMQLSIVWTLMVSFGTAHAALINVNFEQFTPGLGTFETENTLEGPAGGLGTEWNQFADEDSSGILVDSTGANTTVAFNSNYGEGRNSGGNDLTMLNSLLTDFGKGAVRTINITGLTPGGEYDVWLVTFRNQSTETERNVGTWSTSNTTSSPSTQLIDNRGALNGSTFVENYNYVLFDSVIADGLGQMSFTSDGGNSGDSFDGGTLSADFRMGLNGFQIQSIPAPAALPAGLALFGLLAVRRKR